MPPTKDKTPKAAGKGKADDKVPTTKLEFGYPPDLTNALRAISDRATQDLWHNPSGVGGGEPTAEQLAQKHANTIHKLSKRIAGDVRAKEALRSSLSQWTSALGHHLAALVPRIQAISQKLDDDLSEACQDMQAAAVVSATSQEKISQAQAQLGPAWSYMQKQEIYKIAGALRAFGSVQPGGNDHLVEAATDREESSTAATVIEDDEELLPDQPHQSSSPSWFASWLQVISFAVGQGADFIGDLANSAEQDAALPLHPDPQIEGATVAQAEALWTELCHMTASPQERLMEGLYIRLRDFGTFARPIQLCPIYSTGASYSTMREGYACLGSSVSSLSLSPWGLYGGCDVLCIVLLLVVSPAINTFAVKGSVRMEFLQQDQYGELPPDGERSGDRGQTHDEQLEEVMDMLATDLSVSNGGRASSAAVPDDMLLDEFKKRTLESAQLEAEESAAKKTREGRVSQEDDVFHWDEHEDLTAVEGEDVEYEDLVEEEMEDAPKNEQGETPPELSPEALDAMDQEAAVEELNRLSKIGVIEESAES
ncbi:unnamed protein product, partial [Symbiodinium sp. KB8]